MPAERHDDAHRPSTPASIDWRGRLVVLVQFTLLACVANVLAMQLPGATPFLVGNMAAVAIALRFDLRWSLPVAACVTGITGEVHWLLLALLECVLVARLAPRGYRAFGLWWRVWLPLSPIVAWITLPPGSNDALQWALSIAVVLLTGATSIIGGRLLVRVTRTGRQMAALPLATQLSVKLATLTAAPVTMAIITLLQWGHQQDLQHQAILLDGKAEQLVAATRAHLRLHRDAITQAAAVVDALGPDATFARVSATYPGFLTMLAASEDGRIVAAHRRGEGPQPFRGNVADRDYFTDALTTGEPVISSVFRGRGIGTEVIVAVAAPVPPPRTTSIAVVQGAVGLNQVALPLRNALDTRGLRYAVIDAHSQMVFSSLPDQPALTPIGEPGSLASGPQPRPWWAKALLTAPEIRFDARGRHLVTETLDEAYGWRVSVLQPVERLERMQTLRSLAAALLVLGILLALQALSARFANRHTRGLAAIAARLRDLDLDRGPSAFGPLGVHTSAELTELAEDSERTERRLHEMHASLRASAEELVDLNRELEQRVESRTGELRLALARAEHLAAAKASFLANMSHELRTPLAAILGYSEQGLREGAPPAEVRRCLQTVVRNGRHLLEIVNDVLDASKIEAGQLHVQTQPTSPVDVAGDAVALLRQRAKEKGLDMLLSAHWPLPARVMADPLRLKQILLNLLSNAIKFTSAGFIVVRVDADAASGQWTIEVEDTGIGMSQEQCERVFQRFEQADDSTTRRFGGTGLGLYISRQLARQMGGDLTARSTPGAGSRFLLQLPVGMPMEWIEEGEDFHIEEAPVSTTVPALRGRVLVVDDVDDLRLLVRARVEATGAEVIEAANGEEACTLVRSLAPDLVLMDMHMPVMDGREAVRTLRAEGHRVPIYACSADVLPDDVSSFLALGCDGALAKPLDEALLFAVLTRHLEPAAALPPEPAPAAAPAPAAPSDPLALALKAVRDRFVAGAAAERAALAEAQERGDLATLRQRAHRLKGSAGTFGFGGVSEAAAALELALAAGPDAIAEAVHALDAALAGLD